MAKLERPALGRHAQLGMLYDCRTDALLPGQMLWEPHVLQADCVTGPYLETQPGVILTDSFSEKSAALGVDDSLKASILAGLVKCSGAAELLHHRAQSNNRVRVALHHKMISRYEQMTFRYAGEHNIQQVCARGLATHVVTGILYGAHSFFLFDRPTSPTDNTNKIRGTLESMTKKIQSIGIGEKSVLMLHAEEEREVDMIQCTVFSDTLVIQNPSSYRNAVQIYANVLSTLGNNNEKAIPVRMWLYPLASLNVPINLTPNPGSSVINKTEILIEGLEGIQTRCDDLASQDICVDFPPFAEKLRMFKKLVKDYKSSFLDKLQEIIPRVRNGEMPVKEWTDLLTAAEHSPYRLSGLTSWITEKEKEMSVIKSYMKTFSSSTIIRTRNQLDELILTPGKRYVVCFSFPLIGHEDKYLGIMTDYLKNPQNSDLTYVAWCDEFALCRNMRTYAKQFTDYAQANSEREDAVFVVSGHDDGEEKSTEAGSIFLYELGILKSKTFEPPGVPINVMAVEISHETSLLKWAQPECRQSEIQYYLVKYREKGQEDQQGRGVWEEVKTEQGETEMHIVGLEASTSYECRVSAVCKFGLSSQSFMIMFKTSRAYPPGSMKMCQVTQKSITVSWVRPPICGSVNIGAYKVAYNAIDGGHKDECGELVTQDANCIITIQDLQPGTSYRICVSAVYSSGSESEKSEAAEFCTRPANKYAQNLAKRSKMLKPGDLFLGEPAIYKIPLKREASLKGGKYQTFTFGRDYRKDRKHSVIMIVGATGAGKSTLINGMINFITGVEWTDKFRFQLIEEEGERKFKSQAHSQTQMITSYTIHQVREFNLDYTLTIIDTPGFGDTRGIERDKMIIEQIKEFFDNASQHHIDHIDAIGFVAQASQARLTHTQRYIFDSVLSIFGKDVEHNIVLLVTFADGKKPPVIDAIREANIPCSERVFQFNNSALFTMGEASEAEKGSNGSPAEENIGLVFWRMGAQSMSRFFADLSQLEPKSLSLTRDVLEERQRLEIAIEGLQPQIHAGHCKLDQLQREQQFLEQFESEIQANQDFEYEIEITKPIKIDITGAFITNCSMCHYTCHYPCRIPRDEDKKGCKAMADGFCTVCPEKCPWNVHYNMKYKFEYHTEKEKRTYEDLQKRYNTATGEKLTKEQLIKQLEQELLDVQVCVFGLIKDCHESYNRLEKIALKPNPLSTADYIDLMIESEKREAQPNWKFRVESLECMKSKAKLLSKVQETDFDSFENYKGTEQLKKVLTGKNKEKGETSTLAAKIKKWFTF